MPAPGARLRSVPRHPAGCSNSTASPRRWSARARRLSRRAIRRPPSRSSARSSRPTPRGCRPERPRSSNSAAGRSRAPARCGLSSRSVSSRSRRSASGSSACASGSRSSIRASAGRRSARATGSRPGSRAAGQGGWCACPIPGAGPSRWPLGGLRRRGQPRASAPARARPDERDPCRGAPGPCCGRGGDPRPAPEAGRWRPNPAPPGRVGRRPQKGFTAPRKAVERMRTQ